MLHAGAFNWTYTLGTGLMDPWTVGATALIPAPGSSPDQIAALMAEHNATIFAAAPGVYRQMMKHDLPELPKLRHGLSAGEKLPATTRDEWNRRTGKKIFEAYGMSECSTFISGSPIMPPPKAHWDTRSTGAMWLCWGKTANRLRAACPVLWRCIARTPA